MADDVVDTIAQYDLDDDFPDYANEQNKELNQIVSLVTLTNYFSLSWLLLHTCPLGQRKGQIGCLAWLGNRRALGKIEDPARTSEVSPNGTCSYLVIGKFPVFSKKIQVDAKNKEIETEEHMKQIAERQSGRLRNEIEKLEQRIADQQDRLNNIQNMIFKANEKMDQFKLEMNWNQEELEQWALAARQKEEDNLTLEKYRRADEAKIKELTLTIEKLTVEVARKAGELEKEVTETQAAQIELDKTAEEFKRLHAERHQLYLQWQDTVENSRKRDELINETGEQYGSAKDFLDKKKVDLEDHKRKLEREKENNKEQESSIAGEERTLTKIRESLAKHEEERNNLEGEVAILRNQLSAFATELANKRNNVANMNAVLEEKMQRLEAAKKKYQATKERLSKEQDQKDHLEAGNKASESEYKESQNMLDEVEKEIRLQKETLFKESQKLFKLRAEQANLIGDISGTLSASRNLQANIIKLKQEQQRQQELLYNAEFQIQQMERRVSRAQGERSQEETKKLQADILKVQKELEEKKKQLDMLTTSNKQLEDERRNIERQINKVKDSKGTLSIQIQELKLENEMAGGDVDKVQKRKEKTLVQHDCMKLEIKKLRDTVNVEADRVYGLENRKYQLEMSMEEREKEIQVHKDILVSELKAAEEERHKVAVELQLRKNKVKNLRIKYEGLVQKSQSSSGEVEAVGEHSQAYYVIKAAQEKEELQRYGDELDGKIRKCEKEIKALANTLDHLKMRNKNYRDKFM